MGRLEFRQKVHLRAHIGVDIYCFRLKLSAVYHSFHSWLLCLCCFMWRKKFCCRSVACNPHCAFSYSGQHSTALIYCRFSHQPHPGQPSPLNVLCTAQALRWLQAKDLPQKGSLWLHHDVSCSLSTWASQLCTMELQLACQASPTAKHSLPSSSSLAQPPASNICELSLGTVQSQPCSPQSWFTSSWLRTQTRRQECLQKQLRYCPGWDSSIHSLF